MYGAECSWSCRPQVCARVAAVVSLTPRCLKRTPASIVGEEQLTPSCRRLLLYRRRRRRRPSMQEKGLVAPRTSHDDAVLDVKVTELPTKMLLSGSRDGAVKIWK